MRHVKVAAIQPEHIGLPARYSPYRADYDNDADAIIENYVLKQLAVTQNLLEKAGAEGCDMVTTCEDVSVLGDFAIDVTSKNILVKLVKQVRPYMEKAFSEISKKYHMYVIGCYLQEQDGKIYNTAVIFDRGGHMTGVYRKTHLPANEAWLCTPGDSLDVFETDFGKIGICICYDMMFPETVRVLKLKGAEIIFHPTFGYGWYDSIGEATLRTRANDNGVYIVTSKSYLLNGAGKSSVIDPWGHVLADAGFEKNTLVHQRIDLDMGKKQPDWYINSVMSGGIADVAERMRRERRPELYAVIAEPSDQPAFPNQTERLRILEGIRAGEIRW